MIAPNPNRIVSSVFITFTGNCKKALTFYQSCFGGLLQFETFDEILADYAVQPVISGSLVSERIIIYGSDLVHPEGRKIGNYMAILIHCDHVMERRNLVNKLVPHKKHPRANENQDQKLIEIIDAFEVRWVLSV